MITKKDYPSYAHLIEQGETTLVESFQPDGKSCGSHNHHFFGDIARWFINCIVGLNVVDYQNVEVKPYFIEKLNFASAYYDLPAGRVSVEWKRSNDGVKLDVKCPDCIKYSIKLPEGYSELDGIIKNN